MFLFVFFSQVDEDWKELFKDAQNRNILFHTDSSKDAVKYLLKEKIDGSNTTSTRSVPNNRDQQRGVLLLEDAPMPSRPKMR